MSVTIPVQGSDSNTYAVVFIQNGETYIPAVGILDSTGTYQVVVTSAGSLQTVPQSLSLAYLAFFSATNLAVTAAGYFVDLTGKQTGVSFSGSIPVGSDVADPQTLAGLYGAAIPAAAVGVYLTISGAINWVCTADTDDFQTNFARYPSKSTPGTYTFGQTLL